MVWEGQVEGEQFVSAIAEALEPRMSLTGEMGTLDKFKVPPPPRAPRRRRRRPPFPGRSSVSQARPSSSWVW